VSGLQSKVRRYEVQQNNNWHLVGFYSSVITIMHGPLNIKYTKTVPSLQQAHVISCRSQWPRGLTGRFSAARLLRLWVRISVGTWMSVCCECCVCCQVEVSATS